MVRSVLITVTLMMALSIGYPYPSSFGDWSYSFLRQFGLDVSMTPMTIDMAMMLDENNGVLYSKRLELVLDTDQGEVIVAADKLDLYHHKVPLNLYFEIIGNGGIFYEGKVYLCRSLTNLLKQNILSFKLKILGHSHVGVIYEPQICD